MPESSLMGLLAINVATNFVISGSGRIDRENDPDASPGPHLFWAGCGSGNIARVRHDLCERTARKILALIDTEPPWSDPNVQPRCLNDLLGLISRKVSIKAVQFGLIYTLPHNLTYETGTTTVCSGSYKGKRMLASLAEKGLPQHLIDAGFVSVTDFWEPWCVALEGREIASIAFAARIGTLGAEIGVFTFPGFRGRGLAATIAAKWSSLRALKNRTLFYSTQRTNYSSQRVAERLGLQRIAASIRIT